MTLDAAAYLLLAEGHLMKAKEELANRPGSCPYFNTEHALETTRLALRQLKYEKEGWPCEEGPSPEEEPCNKP